LKWRSSITSRTIVAGFFTGWLAQIELEPQPLVHVTGPRSAAGQMIVTTLCELGIRAEMNILG
jgi:hypothetical protein